MDARTHSHIAPASPASTRQLELAGIEPPRRKRHNIFFAVLPPRDIADQIAQIAFGVRTVHRLQDEPFENHRLHVSLLGFGDHVEFPLAVSIAARSAATSIVVPRFETTFDRILSFSGRSRIARRRPFVLRAPDGAGFSQLRRLLGNALGFRLNASYTPHMTLLYDETIVPEFPISPIRWTVDEFVLVHSLIKRPGEQKRPYSIIGRWKLT